MASLTNIDDTLDRGLDILRDAEMMLDKLDGELFGFKPQNPSSGADTPAIPPLTNRIQDKAHNIVSSAARLRETIKSLTESMFDSAVKVVPGAVGSARVEGMHYDPDTRTMSALSGNIDGRIGWQR
jgi:hypothetical protein